MTHTLKQTLHETLDHTAISPAQSRALADDGLLRAPQVGRLEADDE